MAFRVRNLKPRTGLAVPLKWTLGGIAITLVAGTLSHFVFEWLGRWPPLALVFPVNESTWEHLKLAFWPMLLWALVERPALRGRVNNFLAAEVTGITVAITAITVIFYTYTGIIGHDVMWLDLLDFAVSVALGYIVRLRIMGAEPAPGRAAAAAAVIGALLVAFLTFTFFPPAAELFRDPRTGEYGIPLAYSDSSQVSLCKPGASDSSGSLWTIRKPARS
ncbi:MAG: DUF6512 family protein [Chloroflexota bacterium]